MSRIFCDAVLHEGAEIILPETTAHYLLHVMRRTAGDSVYLFNAHHGEWQANLSQPSKKTLLASCVLQRATARPSLPLTLCFAPIKGGRTEAIIEKATELGVRAIQPVKTQRTIVASINHERLALIAREAAEQSERFDVPEILPMQTLPNLLGAWPEAHALFYGDESGNSAAMLAADGETPPAWGVLIGPEGGFTPEEFHLLQRKKCARGVALGPRILRADTACFTLLAITAQHFGDWHERPHFKPY
jgi:16S rRNA (uracil1498-N3)-methyltransferase